MSLVLPKIETDLELWLSVLADNELDGIQRRQLAQHLEANSTLWRACAVALMDQQLIASKIGQTSQPKPASSVEPDMPSSKSQTGESRKHKSGGQGKGWRRAAAAAIAIAASIAMLYLGAWTAQSGLDQQRTEWSGLLESKNRQIAQLNRLLAFENIFLSSQSLAGLYPDKPMLIEIENTPGRTLYLTDRPVSDAILESFAAAGHVVDVNPYRPRLMTARMRSLASPVLAVEVYKSNPILLAQGVSK